MSPSSVERVFAAAVEEQARSPRFIQKQLSKLHAALVEKRGAITGTIQTQSQHTTAEVELQYALALEAVATLFADLDFDKALEAEYSLARGENVPSGSVAVPLAYIIPSRYNLFYSCVTAVAAAISAGSCVILEMPQTLSRISSVTEEVLSGALDSDTFVIVDKRIERDGLPPGCVRVFGSADATIVPSRMDLMPASTRSIAIIDRTADMRGAAASIVRARFAFGGQSPFGPDLVLVNEFKVKELCSSIAELTTKYFAAQVDHNHSTPDFHQHDKGRIAKTSSQNLNLAGVEVVISGSRGCVALVTDRTHTILKKRVQEPLLLVHPVRSVDDAINFTNSDDVNNPLATVYTFGSPEVAKYVSQFVDAHVSCANDIPAELLVRPASPVGYAVSLSSPYTRDMFRRAKSEFIRYDARTTKLASIVDGNDVPEAIKIRRAAETPNVIVRQPPGHAVGFFEQGLLLGASIAVVTLIAGNVLAWKYGLPLLRKRIGV